MKLATAQPTTATAHGSPSPIRFACLPPQGRPKSGPEDKYRLTPVAPRLSQLLGKPVKKTNDCIGAEVEAAVKEMKNGEPRVRTARYAPEHVLAGFAVERG